MAKKSSVGRRGFLTGAGAAAGLAMAPQVAVAQTSAIEVKTPVKPGSDFMVDVIRSLGIEYCAANPGSSFRGIHESIVNYAGNKMPELLTCLHEESSAAMAHGYAKIEGKPMMIMVHGTVGLQHASMANGISPSTVRRIASRPARRDTCIDFQARCRTAF